VNLPPLLSPLTLAVAALALTALRRRIPGAGRLAGVLAALAWLAMTPLGANLQVWAWEHAVPRAAAGCGADQVRQIVMLTGGLDRSPTGTADAAALTPDSLHRVFFVRGFGLAHPDAPILVVGGGDASVPESRIAARLLADLGVPPGRLAAEERSATTWENAQAVAAWRPRVALPLHLVTGGLHLPRAMRAFQAAGLAVCPVAADSRFVRPAGVGALWPQGTALQKTEAVWHEVLGTLRDLLR
jgi:uncharacterized SAM-binding protein YcdF (DUF218 family)